MVDSMVTRILSELSEIEKREQVQIVYAVESGSRGWGFASEDSDYDVRFIYIRPLEWYLSIDPRRDVIELPLEDNLDICGWDIKKALTLFRKSNPPLLEWLRSPVVYIEKGNTIRRLRDLLDDVFSPVSGIYHYLHMAEGNYRDYLMHEKVYLKKYLYVLRPLLACSWIEQSYTPPPMEFQKLLDTQLQIDEVKREIVNLLTRKVEGDELTQGDRISCLNEYIEKQIGYFSTLSSAFKMVKPPSYGPLNQIFLDAVRSIDKSD